MGGVCSLFYYAPFASPPFARSHYISMTLDDACWLSSRNQYGPTGGVYAGFSRNFSIVTKLS